VVLGESMEGKEESGTGEWIYLRDGTSLTELLRKELGVSVVVGGEEVEETVLNAGHSTVVTPS